MIAMPRDGSMILSNVSAPTLSRSVCEPGGRRGRTSVEKLIAEHGGAKLTELLSVLADCPKARPVSVYDRCKAVYEGL